MNDLAKKVKELEERVDFLSEQLRNAVAVQGRLIDKLGQCADVVNIHADLHTKHLIALTEITNRISKEES